ncbi:hypothetical protein MKD33_17920, partial [Chromobacterium piscinae]
MALAARL